MICYYKLFDLLARSGYKNRTDLKKIAGISGSTLAKLSANSNVAMSVIDKICKGLSCQPGDIMEYIEEEKE